LDWIDAHHHLWDLSRIGYPWLQAQGEARFFGQPDPIRKDYLLDDFQADIDGRIAYSVHVQVGARAEDELNETAFVAECSQKSGGRYPAAAVVAMDLGQPDIDAALEAHQAFAVTRGVRHMIGKSPEENPTLPPFVPQVWIPNWRRLARLGLSFDLQLTEDQFPGVLAALRQVAELKVSICHLASPWDRSAEGFKRWRAWMRQFAELPNLTMKISGFSMFSKRWDEPAFLEWAAEALDIFGAGRCMLGSNFPVDSLYVTYDDLYAAWEKLIGQCSQPEAERLAGGTAADFYSITPSPELEDSGQQPGSDPAP
jgi:predicted TIM-barrel fold metal-dependent hydrolase